ncbi:uncharacterized protein LOC141691047 [Apium graveolens]|uniref:uncharacterized protein LOC141691047 n=1 Tax=Apium graveolens TaxID=4045 RepID=UPI003D7B7F1F
MSPWPFAMCGIDLIGELPKAKGGVKCVVVAVDYCTKWAEAEPLEKLKESVHRTIVCRYGIPYKLISDNGNSSIARKCENFVSSWGFRRVLVQFVTPKTTGRQRLLTKSLRTP